MAASQACGWVPSQSAMNGAAATAISEDQTRVYAVMTWPIVLALVTRAGPRLAHRHVTATACGALLLGLMLPAVFLWRGDAFLAEHHLWHIVTG